MIKSQLKINWFFVLQISFRALGYHDSFLITFYYKRENMLFLLRYPERIKLVYCINSGLDWTENFSAYLAIIQSPVIHTMTIMSLSNHANSLWAIISTSVHANSCPMKRNTLKILSNSSDTRIISYTTQNAEATRSTEEK